MLNKTENALMQIIYDKCGLKGSCLISVEEIKINLKSRGVKDGKIKKTMNSLELDGYFDGVLCDKDGEEVYCVNLLAKGYSYKRETVQRKRNLLYKIAIAILTGVITYIVGKVLLLFF